MTARQSRRVAIANAVEITRGGSPSAIIELLDAPYPVVRAHAATVIARSRLKSATPEVLKKVTTEPDEDVRNKMTLALTMLQAPESAETFVELLGDESEEVRRLALRGLSQLGDPRAIEIAPRFYASGGRHMRHEAIDALGTLGTPDAVAALQSLRATERERHWRRAIDRGLKKASAA